MYVVFHCLHKKFGPGLVFNRYHDHKIVNKFSTVSYKGTVMLTRKS